MERWRAQGRGSMANRNDQLIVDMVIDRTRQNQVQKQVNGHQQQLTTEVEVDGGAWATDLEWEAHGQQQEEEPLAHRTRNKRVHEDGKYDEQRSKKPRKPPQTSSGLLSTTISKNLDYLQNDVVLGQLLQLVRKHRGHLPTRNLNMNAKWDVIATKFFSLPCMMNYTAMRSDTLRKTFNKIYDAFQERKFMLVVDDDGTEAYSADIDLLLMTIASDKEEVFAASAMQHAAVASESSSSEEDGQVDSDQSEVERTESVDDAATNRTASTALPRTSSPTEIMEIISLQRKVVLFEDEEQEDGDDAVPHHLRDELQVPEVAVDDESTSEEAPGPAEAVGELHCAAQQLPPLEHGVPVELVPMPFNDVQMHVAAEGDEPQHAELLAWGEAVVLEANIPVAAVDSTNPFAQLLMR